MWGFENYGVVPDVVAFGKGMTAGFGIAGTVTTEAIAEEARFRAGLPWAGTYSGDPFPAAVALKQLQIVIRDGLAERSQGLGERLAAGLEGLVERHECIGAVRGIGLYRLIDVVTDDRTRAPDPEMAERIRYNAALEGLITIAVKNFIRVCPALIITEAEIDETVERLERAIRRAEEGFPREFDYSSSSSLAARTVEV